MLFVHLKDGVVFDGEEDKASLVGFEDGFRDFLVFEDGRRIHRLSLILNYIECNEYVISL